MLHAAERARLAQAGRRLAAAGLVVGSAGNLSASVGDHVVVTPSGGHLGALAAADMVVIDRRGTTVDGTGTPTSEIPLHLALYAGTRCGAVAHVHAPASTAVSCVLTDLPPVHYSCLELGGPVRVAPYATYGSAELARGVVDALGADRHGALMQNHGSVCVGADLAEACDRVELLEWLCDLHLRATALGPPRVLTDAELDAVRARMRATPRPRRL